MLRTSIIYNRQPPPSKLNGVAVTANSPGIAPFAFRAQHGSTPCNGLTEEDVTGFAACTTSVEVNVQDARAAEIELDTHGFTLIADGKKAEYEKEDVQAHERLRDDEKIREEYYAEAVAHAKSAMPGSSFAVAYNHVRRVSRQTDQLRKAARHTAAGLSAPSYMAHTDSTADSWCANLESLVNAGTFADIGPTHLGAAAGETLSKARRVVVLNLWRLIANFGQPSPTTLALCDVRSVDLQGHAVPYHFLVDGCVGYNHGLDHEASASHSWFYYPRLRADEVIVFKAFDSAPSPPTAVREPRGATAGGAAEGATSPKPSWCFHCAIDDPSAPENAKPRESMEVRVALAFD